MEIDLPRELPVMTLPGMVFFPHALLPLHIFEPRYQKMLAEVLDAGRMFAVAQLDMKKVDLPDANEPLHRVATAGIIRACQKNDNGTSNLLLQGLCRVAVVEISREEPYRKIVVEPLPSVAHDEPDALATLRAEAIELLEVKRRLGVSVPEEIAGLVKSVTDPEMFSHLASFALFEKSGLKQRLLETDDTGARLRLVSEQLTREIREAHLHRRLQGRLSDDDIARN